MRRVLLTAALAGAVMSPSLARAEAPLERYQARLSHADHFSSKGVRLEGVAEIIRQDRANYYKYEIRDPEDEPDAFFALESNRLKLEQQIANGNLTPAVREEITYGTPVVEVIVYRNRVDIDLKSRD